jgi:putative Holliday junction resolvase
MPEETLLAFDFGVKKIGVAVGNTVTRQALPLEILYHATRVERCAAINTLLTTWQPERVVVGLPLTTQGADQPATFRCRRFANQLRGRFGVAVVLIDERGSSIEAQELLGSSAADDAQAAAVILQRYLDAIDS